MWLLRSIVLVLLAAPAPAQTMTVELRVTGTVVADVTVSHDVDAAHFCSAAADPWSDDRRVDTRPPPFPYYRVVFGQAGPGQELEQPGPSLGIALSEWAPPGSAGWVEDHEDAAHDSFELMIGGQHFVGHAGLPEPAPRLLFAYRDDGRGGGFLLTGLQGADGEGRLNVEGTWACPAIDLALPEVVVVSRPLFQGAVPATAAPPRLRLALRRDGVAWRATGEDGQKFPADVDLRPLRLAPALRDWAEAGEVVLLVQGEVQGGLRTHVVARRLDGVMPAPH